MSLDFRDNKSHSNKSSDEFQSSQTSPAFQIIQFGAPSYAYTDLSEFGMEAVFCRQELEIVLHGQIFALPKNELPDFLNVGGRMVQRK